MQFRDLIDGKPSTTDAARHLRKISQNPKYAYLRKKLNNEREKKRDNWNATHPPICCECGKPITGIILHTPKGTKHALSC